jgi:hypothetical protein
MRHPTLPESHADNSLTAEVVSTADLSPTIVLDENSNARVRFNDACRVRRIVDRMADPLSITASVIAIGTLAAQVCEILVSFRVRTDFKGRLHTIKSEISDLQTVLNHAVSILAERSKHKLSNDALDAVNSILPRIRTNLKKQDRIAHRLARPSDSTKGKIITSGLWLKEGPKLQQLREELGSLKGSLVMCFGASNT